jgi:hypothetical protein
MIKIDDKKNKINFFPHKAYMVVILGKEVKDARS